MKPRVSIAPRRLRRDSDAAVLQVLEESRQQEPRLEWEGRTAPKRWRHQNRETVVEQVCWITLNGSSGDKV